MDLLLLVRPADALLPTPSPATSHSRRSGLGDVRSFVRWSSVRRSSCHLFLRCGNAWWHKQNQHDQQHDQQQLLVDCSRRRPHCCCWGNIAERFGSSRWGLSTPGTSPASPRRGNCNLAMGRTFGQPRVGLDGQRTDSGVGNKRVGLGNIDDPLSAQDVGN